MKWMKPLATALLAVTLAAAPGAGQVQAAEAEAVKHIIQADFMKLTGKVSAQWVGAYLERSSKGATVGAMVRLKNETGSTTRVPDYELRLLTKDGVAYTLEPSAANPRSIQPKGTAELVYALEVNRTDAFELVKVLWVEVDEYVYPKKEKTLLVKDIAGKVWNSGDAAGVSETALGWGEPFRLAFLSPDLEFTPTGMHQQVTAQGGTATMVTLRAVNKGKGIAYIPDFAISGSDGKKLYAGEKADNKSDVLEAGGARHIRFAIPTAPSVKLSELVVTTPARFVTAAGGELVRHIGHLSIGLPKGGITLGSLGSYEFGKPIALEPSNELVDKDVQISLVELHLHENQDAGYKTAIAKFKLHNTGKQPAPLPAFQAELANAEGYTYLGERQNVRAQQLMPGLSYVVSYAFNVPNSMEEGRFALRLLEGGGGEAAYSTPFAAIGVNMQENETDAKVWNLYPFQVEMKDLSMNMVTTVIPAISYSYRLTLDLDIKRTEDVVVDAGFSKLRIDVTDVFGNVLGSETIPFVGPYRLVSGKQIISIQNVHADQHHYPLIINIYEAIDTPSGEAARLLYSIKR